MFQHHAASANDPAIKYLSDNIWHTNSLEHDKKSHLQGCPCKFNYLTPIQILS
jgi:hypothetical protein